LSEFHFDPATAPPVDTASGFGSLGSLKKASGYICGPTTGPGSDSSNVNTDCDGLTAPHNETSIAVNPTDASNMIGGVNDYQLVVTNGGTVKETALVKAHVSFDSGQTWSEYALPSGSYTATGDPGIAFDANGTAYFSTVGFRFSQGLPDQNTISADILVAHSSDGGKTWSVPTRVAQGVGSMFSASKASLDKPYIAAWGDGNAIETWTNFVQGPKGSYISSPIFDSVSHDGGVTWSAPQQISGSATFCIGDALGGGGDGCLQNQFSDPVYTDGHLYVAFEDTANATTGNDQYLMVEVDPKTGSLIDGPFKIADVVDGSTAYPLNASGEQTYQDSQFRSNSAGDLTADPTTAGHLALVWSDMRNSTLPSPTSPYAATTDSDVVVSQSFDAGRTWSTPVALSIPGDQFQPWGTYDTNGLLRIGYFDRSIDPANHLYGYSLATETSPSSLTFTTTTLSTATSDPTMNDRWFSSLTVNPDFPNPTNFLGDYSNIASDGSGGIVAYWTDLRNTVTFTTRTGAGEDAFFAHSD
jgi:hypothetical protein